MRVLLTYVTLSCFSKSQNGLKRQKHEKILKLLGVEHSNELPQHRKKEHDFLFS